ncbi:hypothetical protein RSSM_00457 [Rhodopirellula sallentina SM41]|uniref:Uncharacterized protein n=1 Tax=Rhodopirellula sallentina SM41 TaxID=1263870 RepID=M5U9I0_9BACT|nr:hypothetical protein RSSM_00457 [Rhodopirellula sallentina SM41]
MTARQNAGRESREMNNACGLTIRAMRVVALMKAFAPRFGVPRVTLASLT